MLIEFIIHFTVHVMSNMKLDAEIVGVPLRTINRMLSFQLNNIQFKLVLLGENKSSA